MSFDCEMPSVYHCDKRKARKEHKCRECRGIIRSGEVYNYHHGIWDGSPGQYKICVDCDALRAEVDKGRDLYDRTPFEFLHESVFDGGDAAIIRSFIGIKRKRGAEIAEWMLRKDSAGVPATTEA